MARTRAARRAQREAERARRIAAARERNELLQRRRARFHNLRERLRLPHAPGLVARTRRRRARLVFLGIFMVNAITWLITSDVAARGFVAVVSVLIFPMLAVFLVGRAR